MTKKRDNNPFGIKGFNANNPFNIKSYRNTGFKMMPKSVDPFKVTRSTRSFDKQYNMKIPEISIPKIKPISKIFVPNMNSIFESTVNRNVIPQNRGTRFVQRSCIPTLSEIIKEYKRKFDENREKVNRNLEAERQAKLQSRLRVTEREPTFIIQHVPVRNHIENSISQIHEKLSQKDKEVADLQNKVKKVTDDVTELKERVKILENYDHELIEQITSLLKIKNEQGENMPADAMALLTELLKEKQKTEIDIESIKTKLNEIDEQQKKVVEQQEKDVPFNQSLRKLLDDAKDDSQVL